MRRIARTLALTAGLATAVWPLTLVAGEGPVTPGPVFAPKITVDTGPTFTPAATRGTSGDAPAEAARIADDIDFARDYCGWIQQKEYVVDCLSDELNRVADSIDANGDYAEARVALKQASRDLSALVAQNESATIPPGVARSTTPGDDHTSTRPLRAVETAKLDAVSTTAIGIIEETGTILLRSSSSSEEAAGFTAISAAVNSNTILLRSL